MLARCTTHMVEALTLPEGETRKAVERARDLLATAEAARFAHDQARARTDIDEALRVVQDTGDPPLLAEVWLSRGRILAEAGDINAALEGLQSFFAPGSYNAVALVDGDEQP